MSRRLACGAALLLGAACGGAPPAAPPSPRAALVRDPATFWNSATVYFLLTDRFANGDPGNDRQPGREAPAAFLRGYEGGDLRGLRDRIASGWFNALGIDAIWLTPFQEQVTGATDEGAGPTYAYHGYWIRDWTAVDPNLGTEADLDAVVRAAHARGIRVLMDAVLNHIGPVTPGDPAWPADWVRTGPTCTYRSHATTTACTLVRNLPDVLTESDRAVELPPTLVAKWAREGRLARERAELDEYFRRTGHPRAPRYYLIKWLTDWVREHGIDGYRVDTAKHFEESVSTELREEADRAFADWKSAHPGEAIDDLPFFMVGEVYGWSADQGRRFDFGDRTVDFFGHGYDALINFGLARRTAEPTDALFTRYATSLDGGPLRGVAMLNYLASHDDGSPWDRERAEPIAEAERLLLAPGAAQVYYGDEVARPLRVDGADGDANLRLPMRWDDTASARGAAVLDAWRRLGRFRQAHPAIGAGRHLTLRAAPLVFARTLDRPGRRDRVVVAIAPGSGEVTLPVGAVFPEGARVRDAWSGERATVQGGRVTLRATGPVVLLDEAP